jgi:hypothetical protein
VWNKINFAFLLHYLKKLLLEKKFHSPKKVFKTFLSKIRNCGASNDRLILAMNETKRYKMKLKILIAEKMAMGKLSEN